MFSNAASACNASGSSLSVAFVIANATTSDAAGERPKAFGGVRKG